MLNSKTPQFEEMSCSALKSAGEVLNLLNYEEILSLLDKPGDLSLSEILRWMINEKMVTQVNGSGSMSQISEQYQRPET